MSRVDQTDDAARRRVLLLTVSREESEALDAGLRGAELHVVRCADVDQLCAEIARGAGLAVIASECLGEGGTAALRDVLRRQPEWSDIPLILLTPAEQPRRAGEIGPEEMDAFRHVAVLDRPLSPRTLVSAVKLAARARLGQYAGERDRGEQERTERRLHETASRLGERVDRQSETLRLLRDVATAANFAESVDEALSFALAQICRYAGWSFGYAFLPAGDDPDCLVPMNASYESAPGRYRAFRAVTRSQRIPRGEGLVGRVLASGLPEWTRGNDGAPEAARAQLADDAGVATAAAFPIMVGAEVVGVLEFFSEGVADPSPDVLDAMTSIGTQLGRVIERDRMDRAVRDSHRLIEKIGEASPTMIRIYDEVKRCYVHVNDRMARFLGRSAEALMQSDAEELNAAVHPEDLERFLRAKEQVRQPGQESPVTWQVRMRNASGEWRWVRTWGVVFARDEERGPSQTLSISIDVTDEVRVEEKFRQTERLTSIGTLAAGIAHEINNPLASVVITAQLLRRQGLGEKNDEMLENLIEDAKRCGRIVRSVQKFARQEPADRVSLQVNSMVRAAEELSRATLKRSGIGLRLELGEDLPAVTGDATELEQVVLNLITNAAHASESGQEVVVTTFAADGLVRVIVRDEGHGMSPEVQRHVFDPFFTTRNREGGTGLGLSIVHGILQDHGGTIEMDSAPGLGTTVTVTLPAAKPAP